MNHNFNPASENASARGNLDRQGPDHQAAPPGEISTPGLRNLPPTYETAIRCDVRMWIDRRFSWVLERQGSHGGL